jgi:hypothetical protein
MVEKQWINQHGCSRYPNPVKTALCCRMIGIITSSACKYKDSKIAVDGTLF